jgi:hypothetical protein
MATTNPRQSRPAKKALPETTRFAFSFSPFHSPYSDYSRAWTGARASPTFSPPPNSSPRPQPTTSPASVPFPSLSQTNGARHDTTQDRVLQSLSGLTVRAIKVSLPKTSLLTDNFRELLSHFKQRQLSAMKVLSLLQAARGTPLESH